MDTHLLEHRVNPYTEDTPNMNSISRKADKLQARIYELGNHIDLMQRDINNHKVSIDLIQGEKRDKETDLARTKKRLAQELKRIVNEDLS